MILREIKINVSAGTTQTTDTDDQIEELLDRVTFMIDILESSLRGEGFDVEVVE